MGNYPEAYLCFGVSAYDPETYESALPFTYPHELKDWLAERAGLEDPYARDDYSEWKANNPAECERVTTDFFKAKERLVEACPIEIVAYGGEDPSHIVAIRGTVQRATWDRPVKVEPMPLIKPSQLEAAREFCNELGVQFVDLAWLLVADYG